MQRFLDWLSRVQQRHALLLFLVFGAVLFTVDALRSRETPLEAPAVAGEDPAQWLEDEVLYREALARGLGEGDLIVRRRLVQKMRMLLETGVEVAEPGDAELQAWVNAHGGRYGALTRLSLDHVFLSRSLHGQKLAADADQVGKALNSQAPVDLAALSNPHPAGTAQEQVDARGIERLFGPALAGEFASLPMNRWQGPLPSALGLHFVRLRERQLQSPDFTAVRERALRDYLLEQRREATQLALNQLKQRYGLTTQ